MILFLTFYFRFVWPLVVKYDLILAHDSYFCTKFPYSAGFPVQRKESELFVGAIQNKNYSIATCPEDCRRGHKEWIHC